MIKLEFESLDDLVNHLGKADRAEEEARSLRYRLEDEKELTARLFGQIDRLQTDLRVSQGSHAFPRVEPTVEAKKGSVKGLVQAVLSNQKIGAIKEARLLTGLGLKEAKDLVEEVWGTPNKM